MGVINKLHVTRVRTDLGTHSRSFQLRDDGLWETVRFQLLLPVPGTLCRLSSEINSHQRLFDSH